MRKLLLCLLALSLLACGGPADQGKEAQALLDKGVAQFQKQEYDLAIENFKKAAELQPKSAVTYNMLGMAYRYKYNQVRSKELKDQEIAAFQKAIEADPNYWVALINLGATYYYLGERAKAAPLFKKALALNPGHPEKAELEKMIREGERQS